MKNQRAVSLGTRTTRSCPQAVGLVLSFTFPPASSLPSLVPPVPLRQPPESFDDEKACHSSGPSVSSCDVFEAGETIRISSYDRPPSLPWSDPGLAATGVGPLSGDRGHAAYRQWKSCVYSRRNPLAKLLSNKFRTWYFVYIYYWK